MSDPAREPFDAAVGQCESRLPTVVFSHYAYGDPQPAYELYIGETDDEVGRHNAITIYVRCERMAGHAGKHLARGTRGWTEA